MPDPLRSYRHGGLEQEMEVILGAIRTRDDLEAKVHKNSRYQHVEQLVSDKEEDEAGDDKTTQPTRPAPKKKGWKKKDV